MELKQRQAWLRKRRDELLIVPYGIETTFRHLLYLQSDLLIVPYGIETLLRFCSTCRIPSFNRTLWN